MFHLFHFFPLQAQSITHLPPFLAVGEVLFHILL